MPDTETPLPLHELLHQREWLNGLARALLRDHDAAEDAAQQTWLQALVARGPVRDGRGWLASVLANVVRARHRSDVRRTAREGEVAAARSGHADAAVVTNERFETQRTVAAAVQSLDEPFRSTVLLHHFEGMSLAAISKDQNVPAGTVRWRLHRAHELLREALAARLGRDEWRGALAVLCVPLRRSVLLAPAAALLLGAVATIGLTLWVTTHRASEPPANGAEVVAATIDARVDERQPDAAAARTATAETPSETPAAPAATPRGDQQAVVRARIVDSEGTPLGGATLRLAEAEFAGEKLPLGMLGAFAPSATSGPDGRIALAVRAPRELLALAIDLPKGELVAKAKLIASADGHGDENVELFVANGDDRDLGTIELASLSTIAGRVLDPDGRPLGDVRVCSLAPPFPQFCDRLARAQHVPNATIVTTTADGTGSFELTGVRAGPTIVWASKPGHASAWRLLDVAARHTHCDDLTLRLDVAPPPEPQPIQTDLRVLVVDCNDEPVRGARVLFRQRYANGGTSHGSTTVDAAGYARLPTVRFGRGDDAPLDLELAASSDRSTLASVVVPRPDIVDGEVRIVLPPATPFELRASTEDGAALAEFTVVWIADAPAYANASTRGARGVATFAPPPMSATIQVSAPGCAMQHVRFVPNATTSPLAVTLAPLRGITGIVTAGGKPIVNARVSVLDCESATMLDGYRSVGTRAGNWDARTGSDGRFRIDREGAGVLRLQVRTDDLAAAVTEAHDYDPQHGWNDVAIELTRGGTIEGVVRDAAGVVVPRALVVIHDFHGDARTVFADAAGRFRCDRLRAGGHEVRIADRELDGTWSTMSSLGSENEDATPHPDCDVKDGEVTRFDLVTDRCRLAGLLVATGFDARGWRAKLMRAHDGLPACKDAVLRGDGAFTLTSSSSGPHDLLLTAPGGPLGNVSAFVRVELVAGDNTVNVPLALAPLRANAAGASGTKEGDWAYLKQQSTQHRVLTYVNVDPATLDFAAPLAPVGDNVLFEGSGLTIREVGRFVVAPR